MTMTMTILDWVLLAIVALSAILGIWRGFVKEALSLVGWLVSFYVAWQFSASVLEYHVGIIDFLNAKVAYPAARYAIVFATLFLATMLVFWMITFVICQVISMTPLALINSLFGFVFGILRGAVIVLVLITILESTPIANQETWKNSKVVPEVQKNSQWLKDGFAKLTA